MSSNTISVKKFDIDNFQYENNEFTNLKIAIIGRGCSGKSWLTRDILQHLKNIPTGFVINESDKYEKFYEKFIHADNIVEKLDQSIMNKIIEKKENTFLVTDIDRNIKKDPLIENILHYGRHYGMTSIFSFLSIFDLQPEYRQQFDYIFIFPDDSYLNRQKIHKNFVGMINFDIFNSIMDQLNSDNNYSCMVINKCDCSDDLSKKIFWYKASEIKNLKKFPKFLNLRKRKFVELEK